MEFKESKTYQNLLAAFAAESVARTKYNIYSQICKNSGYEQMASIFAETAHNEKEHAEIWFKWIHQNSIPGILEALKDGKNGEHFEWTDMCIRSIPKPQSPRDIMRLRRFLTLWQMLKKNTKPDLKSLLKILKTA